jgi:hypothetical protein
LPVNAQSDHLWDDRPPQGAFMVIEVDQVESLYQRALERGLPIQQESKDQEWGHRSFCIREPNGLTLNFASLCVSVKALCFCGEFCLEIFTTDALRTHRGTEKNRILPAERFCEAPQWRRIDPQNKRGRRGCTSLSCNSTSADSSLQLSRKCLHLESPRRQSAHRQRSRHHVLAVSTSHRRL